MSGAYIIILCNKIIEEKNKRLEKPQVSQSIAEYKEITLSDKFEES